MLTGKSFSHTVAASTYSMGTGYVTFYFQEYYDIAGNYSTVAVTGASISHSHYGGKFYVNATLTTSEGVSVAAMANNAYSGYVGDPVSGAFPITSGKIYHDDATGEKTVTINIRIDNLFNSGVGFQASGSGSVTVTLTPIARLSELSAGSGTLGTAQTLTVSRKSTAYTHTITYACGSASGTICTQSSDTSISWTAPLSLASQNTTGTTVSVVFTTTTYSGNTAIGSNTKTITCTIPASIKPAVSDGWARVAPYNTGTKAEGFDAYVQGYSRAQVTFDSSKIDMSGTYGASIASYSITHSGASVTADPYRTGVLTAAGSNTVTCTVFDTRGRSASVSMTITVHAYANPTLSGISVYRSNSVGTADDEGVYISVLATANISSIGGLNTPQLQARYGLNGGSYGDYTTLTSEVRSQIGGGNVLTTMSYMMELLLTDGLGNTVTYTQVIPTAEVMFHGRDGGKGGAFGKYAEEDDLLDVDWNIRGRKNLYLDGTALVGENIELFSDDEGGNINLLPHADNNAADMHYWSIDTNDGYLRFYGETNDGENVFPMSLLPDGSVAFYDNAAQTRENLGAVPSVDTTRESFADHGGTSNGAMTYYSSIVLRDLGSKKYHFKMWGKMEFTTASSTTNYEYGVARAKVLATINSLYGTSHTTITLSHFPYVEVYKSDGSPEIARRGYGFTVSESTGYWRISRFHNTGGSIGAWDQNLMSSSTGGSGYVGIEGYVQCS